MPAQVARLPILLKRLEALLEEASTRLPNVTIKRLFGCLALYRTSGAFALVWKTGRIGVKLPLAARHNELMSIAGAEPWVAHAVMSQWVLVPSSYHDDPLRLFKWLKVAHKLADNEVGSGRTKGTPKVSGPGIANSSARVKSKASTVRKRKTNPR